MQRGKTGLIKNCGITAGILGLATAVCFFLQNFATTDTHVPLLFVLAVLFVSKYTDGYGYGIVASLIAVVGVNFVFTYPYFALNFTITGYPLTFLVMLVVAVTVSTMTTQIKKQEKVKMEAEREKMRGNLLRAVSHDIRTPLTAILGAASGILDNYDALGNAEKRELIEDMKKEAQWLIRIVENLLSITRISGNAEGAKIHTAEEVMEEVIGDAVGKFRNQNPDIQVEVKMPSEMLLVPMDGILIEQVLMNLMENSVQHGKTVRKIRIRVTCDKAKVTTAVEDDGCGISKSVLPSVFEGKFSRQDQDGPDSRRNMGIGLSVCMSIVKAHHGNMKAENAENGGARVSFWLPMEEEKQDGSQGQNSDRRRR